MKQIAKMLHGTLAKGSKPLSDSLILTSDPWMVGERSVGR